MLKSRISVKFEVLSRHTLVRDEVNHQNLITNNNRVFVGAMQKQGDKGANKRIGH